MLLIPYLLGSYENASLCDLKKKKTILGGNILFNHFYSRTNPRAQEVVWLAWKHIILELKGNCKKKKINQSKPNSLSSKKIQSQAEKDTQRLSRNNNGKTYIMFKILPEFG